jgi:peptidoglycan/LPS O-acetylase OafA/YrhL
MPRRIDLPIRGDDRASHSPFEIGGSGRSLPVEGLRGVAVGLVFLHHYCIQFSTYTNLSGFTAQFAAAFRNFGGYGVQLFFVLSGFLIYGILLRQQPSFLPFLARRAQRLYPAFIIALAIGIFWDFLRPERKIPNDLSDAAIYLLENILFLPGLLPIEPLFIVNWSMSYEWWFYAVITFLFAFCCLAKLRSRWRISIIVAASAVLFGLSASGLPHVPVRALSLFGGMLLAEASARNWRPFPAVWVVGAVIISLLFYIVVPLSLLLQELVVTLGFCFLCFGAVAGYTAIAVPLSYKYLRWFGNMSYSYYLVHGFFVVICVRGIITLVGVTTSNAMFWVLLLPSFAVGLFAGAILFLWIERPYSFRQGMRRRYLVTSEPVLQTR